MTTTVEENSTALAIVTDLTPMQLFAPGKIRSVVDEIRAKVLAIETDISTPAGRDQIRSLAFKVARSKTFIDEQGKSLVADEKKRLAVIDEERAMVRKELDALRDQVRKPLTDWEDEEKDRIAENERRLMNISSISVAMFISQDQVDRASQDLDDWFNHNFKEFTQKAVKAHEKARLYLDESRKRIAREETERVERDRLAAEAAENARIEREKQIAENARVKAEREAEQRRQAVELATKQREEEQARVAAEEKTRLEREKKAAEDRAAKAEADRIAAAEKAERDRKEAVAKAERERVLAVEAWRKRFADEQSARDAEAALKRAEDEKRAKDKEHRATIHREILADIGTALYGTPDGDSSVFREIITAIAKGKIRHVSITY